MQLGLPAFTGASVAAGSADYELHARANTATTAGAEDTGDLQVDSIVPLRSAQDMGECSTASLPHKRTPHSTDCDADSHKLGNTGRAVEW